MWVLLFFSVLQALDVPPHPDGYISDRAGLLSISTQQQLEETLRTFELTTTHQVVVATFPSLEGDSLESFSIRLAHQWKIGQKGKDNGVILLVFRDDRQIRIEVGYGLEGFLTDATAGLIIQDEIAPYFKKGDFNGGVTAGIQAILKTLDSSQAPSPSPPSSPLPLFRFIFYLVVVIFSVDLFRHLRYRQTHRFYAGRYTFWEWWVRFAILFFAIQILARIILAFLASGGRGYGSRSGFSGGKSIGFSGGGGRFGGGGASGGW